MNAETLAEILGVSPTTIYRYESGAIEKVDSVKLELIAQALKTTPGVLMGRPNLTEAQRKLNDISESLPNAKQSKGWKMLSRGFSRMEAEKTEEYNRIITMLGAAYPEFFHEGDDDDDPRP